MKPIWRRIPGISSAGHYSSKISNNHTSIPVVTYILGWTFLCLWSLWLRKENWSFSNESIWENNWEDSYGSLIQINPSTIASILWYSIIFFEEHAIIDCCLFCKVNRYSRMVVFFDFYIIFGIDKTYMTDNA